MNTNKLNEANPYGMLKKAGLKAKSKLALSGDTREESKGELLLAQVANELKTKFSTFAGRNKIRRTDGKYPLSRIKEFFTSVGYGKSGDKVIGQILSKYKDVNVKELHLTNDQVNKLILNTLTVAKDAAPEKFAAKAQQDSSAEQPEGKDDVLRFNPQTKDEPDEPAASQAEFDEYEFATDLMQTMDRLLDREFNDKEIRTKMRKILKKALYD